MFCCELYYITIVSFVNSYIEIYSFNRNKMIKHFKTITILYTDVVKFMTNDEIFSLSLDIGREIIKSGGEIHRAKDTIYRINKAYGNNVAVFALPSIILAQGCGRMEIRQIEREVTDLTELERLNALSRKLCSKPLEEIQITKNSLYSKVFQIPAVFVATFSFCLFFGGGIVDAILSGIIGIIITLLNISYSDKSLPLFSTNLIESFVAGCLAHLPVLFGLSVMPDKIIIGTIMVLVPGLTIVSAMRDLMNGNLVAGFIELINSVMSALSIALGIAGALFAFGGKF